jgi:hypothetical protein
MAKGQSDRGARTEDSGTAERVPVTDATAGDEGIDDRLGGQPFKPGQRETFVNPPPKAEHDASERDAPRPLSNNNGGFHLSPSLKSVRERHILMRTMRMQALFVPDAAGYRSDRGRGEAR